MGLSLMAVIIAFFDSSQSTSFLPAIQIASLIYLAYACMACGLRRRCTPTTMAFAQAYTVDSGAFLLFVVLAGVTGSAFSYFTSFLILYSAWFTFCVTTFANDS